MNLSCFFLKPVLGIFFGVKGPWKDYKDYEDNLEDNKFQQVQIK